MSDEQHQLLNHSAEDLFQNYSAPVDLFDEMQAAPSTPRPHWRSFLESLKRYGHHELASRWENGRRILREHGVTYNVYGDPQGMDRPWGLDFVPLLIASEEWARIEAGLIQRSRLFNLILEDIYGGSQRLLRDGFLPPELVYANPGFLRPCRGIPVSGEVYLHMLACDLGRSPNGQWWVLADRTQAPSGAGYAWENRTVVSRILPQEIQECNAQRLGGFFRGQREMLFNLAPPGRKQPSVVLLTPGPHNETYFEHAYLARNLGFPLVEGADLTVRDRRVFLKTIEGLQPVDVIVRRVDDSFCDPLELRSDSFLGVSGLVEATRAANVAVTNALGTGMMESPSFLAFLPSLCKHLLGEDLLLPSIATWWCGQAEELHYVIEHLDALTVRPAFGPHQAFSSLGAATSKNRRERSEQRDRMIQMLRASPTAFVAQERMKLSRAPSWVEDHLAPRSVVLRAYVANGGEHLTVLPGGLTRVSKNSNDLVVSMQSGGGSKDTWVLSNGAVSKPELSRPLAESRVVTPIQSGVPSRAADHLFWLGRYTERLEQLLRVLRGVLSRVSGESAGEDAFERQRLVELTSQLDGFSSEKPYHDLPQRILQLLYDQDEPDGVRSLLRRVRSAASAVRDRFSGDTWRILGRLNADSHTRPGRLPLASGTALIHDLVLYLAAFSGTEMENMTRGRGWRFLDFGRRLERGVGVVKLLKAAGTVQTESATVLETVLEISDSVMTYRRQYFASPRWAGVLSLLLLDQANPRSLAFQVNLLREHAVALALDSKSPGQKEYRSLSSLSDALETARRNGFSESELVRPTEGLLEQLGAWGRGFGELSDEVTNRYFSHSLPRMS